MGNLQGRLLQVFPVFFTHIPDNNFTMNRFLKSVFILCMIIFQASSCKVKEEPDAIDHPEYLVFGFYQSPSNCFNSELCIELYKIEPLGLFEDVNDNNPDANSFYSGNFQRELSSAKYNNIHDMFKDNIPADLLNMQSGTIGTTQTWSSNFYFEYKSEKIHKHWIFDGTQQSVPSNLIPFMNILSNASFTAGTN